MTTQETAQDNLINLTIKDVAPFTALCFTTQATLRTLDQHSHAPERLYQEAQRLRLIPSGPLQYIYTDVNGNADNVFHLDIILPVNEVVGEPNDLSFITVRPFHCVTHTHVGPWSDFPELYDALFAEFYRKGYQGGSIVREVYTVVDFENPVNCVTEIQIGLAQTPA